MENYNIDDLNIEEKKEYYVTKLEKIENNRFKVLFAGYASTITGLVAGIWQLYEMFIKNNPGNIPAVVVTGFLTLLAYCLKEKNLSMLDEKAEIRKDLNDMNGKSR